MQLKQSQGIIQRLDTELKKENSNKRYKRLIFKKCYLLFNFLPYPTPRKPH